MLIVFDKLSHTLCAPLAALQMSMKLNMLTE